MGWGLNGWVKWERPEQIWQSVCRRHSQMQLQWLDLMRGYQDNSCSSGHQGDMPYSVAEPSFRGWLLSSSGPSCPIGSGIQTPFRRLRLRLQTRELETSGVPCTLPLVVKLACQVTCLDGGINTPLFAANKFCTQKSPAVMIITNGPLCCARLLKNRVRERRASCQPSHISVA